MSASAINPAMSQRNPWHLKKIAANIADLQAVLREQDELLDAGCCEGHLYDRLGHERYTGIDILGANINEARTRRPGVRFEKGDIFALTEKWDVEFCSRYMLHLPDFEGAIKFLRGIAKRFLIVVIPIGDESCITETYKGKEVQFRTFSRECVLETRPLRVRMHNPYSTVIYDPRLS